MKKLSTLIFLLCIISASSRAQSMTPADSLKLLKEFRALSADRERFFAYNDLGPMGRDTMAEPQQRLYRPWNFYGAELIYMKKEKNKIFTMGWSRTTPEEAQKTSDLFTVIFAELTILRDKGQLVMLSEQKDDSIVYNVYDLKGRPIMMITVKNDGVTLGMVAYEG